MESDDKFLEIVNVLLPGKKRHYVGDVIISKNFLIRKFMIDTEYQKILLLKH